MYGSWLPSVSTAQKYGLRSIDQVGVLMGLVVRQGVTTGTSMLSAQLYLFLRYDTQLSKPASLAFLLTSSSDEYLGRNCLR